VFEKKEFRRQHWCIALCKIKMSRINYTKGMTTVICIYPLVYKN
jgi:hypothetical protein